MSRRIPAYVALGALTTMSALVAANADAATQHHRPAYGPAAAPTVRAESRATHKAGSVALFGAQNSRFHAAKGLTGAKARKTALFDLGSGTSYAAAINPVGGKDGLLCADRDTVYPVHHLRTEPALTATNIDGSGFSGEGGPTFGFFCEGVAMHGSFALATGDSQGLAQLIRKHGHWKIDRRVQSPGLNEAGNPHRPGWIDFRNSLAKVATEFNNVVIAPKAQHNGKYLAVAIDRLDQTLVVVQGAGTGTPKAVGALEGAALANGTVNDGNTGIAFLPSSPNRAVIVTTKGFAVLDLRTPSHPRLREKTEVGGGSIQPSSLTISANGDHIAVSAGARVYGYRNVVAAVTHGKPFHLQTSFRLHPGGHESVSDVAYTSHKRLVVLHGDSNSPADWFLTLVDKVQAGHHAVRGSTRTTQPPQPGSLSVWPAT